MAVQVGRPPGRGYKLLSPTVRTEYGYSLTLLPNLELVFPTFRLQIQPALIYQNRNSLAAHIARHMHGTHSYCNIDWNLISDPSFIEIKIEGCRVMSRCSCAGVGTVESKLYVMPIRLPWTVPTTVLLCQGNSLSCTGGVPIPISRYPPPMSIYKEGGKTFIPKLNPRASL